MTSTSWNETLLARWRKVPTAIVADMSEGHCLIDPDIRPLKPAGQQPRLFGHAVTAKVDSPDFGAVLNALELVRPSDVLVIADVTRNPNAMIGGILGGYLHRKGAAGIICDGTIRDVAELAAMENFSVYTRRISPLGPTSAKGTSVNVPIMIGVRTIQPGDLVIGDDDGLVSMTAEEATVLIDKADKKLALEEDWQRKLTSGETISSVFGLEVP
jgi:4-hydroxy-4-methyl-2-oxoglutarate aldolase